jgi:hypothetical protein
VHEYFKQRRGGEFVDELTTGNMAWSPHPWPPLQSADQSLECFTQHKMLIGVCVLLAAGFPATPAQAEYTVPDAKFEALTPRGFRVSIPGMKNKLPL